MPREPQIELDRFVVRLGRVDNLLINGEWRDHVLSARTNDAWTLAAAIGSADPHVSLPAPAAASGATSRRD